MNKYSMVFSVLFCFSMAQSQYNNAGNTAYPLLSNNYDARSVSMAGAAVAVPNGLYGTFTNPASLAEDIKNTEVYIGYNNIFSGVWGAPIAVARNFSQYGTFALNLYSATSGEINSVDENNIPIDGQTAQYSFVTGGVSWGYKISDSFLIGATIKGVYDHIVGYSSDGFGVDVGLQYRLNSNRLVLGAAVKNIGFMLSSYSNNSDRYLFPFQVVGGISFIPKNLQQIRMAIDIDKKAGDYINFKPGLELNVYKKFLVARLGYAFSERDAENAIKSLFNDSRKDYTKSNWSTLCVGAGLKTNIHESDIKIDLGFQFHSIVVTPSFLISTLVDF